MHNTRHNKHNNKHSKHTSTHNKQHDTWSSTPKKAKIPGHANHVFKKKTTVIRQLS